MSPMKRKTHRRIRLRNGIILALAGIAVVAAVTVEVSSGIRRDIVQGMMREAVDRAEIGFRADLQSLFEPVEAYLRVMERWGEFGALDLADHEALNMRFAPILDEFTPVTSLMVASEKGAEYMILREDNGWLTRVTDPSRDPESVSWRRWTKNLELTEAWKERSAYDPRQRVWYRAALEDTIDGTGDIQWTPPYVFLTTKQIGITLSKYWRSPGEKQTIYVAAVDIPLESIFEFVDRISAGERGRALLITGNGRVLTRDVWEPGSPDSLIGTREPEGPEREAVGSWIAAGGVTGTQWVVDGPGDRLWFEFRSVMRDSTPPYLAVMVPESDFASEVRDRRHRYASMLGALFLLISAVTFIVTRYAFKQELETPAIDLGTESKLAELIAGGEGDRLEFKSTMRWNLAAGKPGKEIEAAWMKTVVAFLNTDGGVLVIGVNDDGEPIGLEADRFANEDKFLLHFNNLFKDHIGLEARPRVNAAIRSLGNKRVFVVECGKAAEPVYLKHGKQETFYVRVGPSSRELPVSEVVKRFRGKGS